MFFNYFLLFILVTCSAIQQFPANARKMLHIFKSSDFARVKTSAVQWCVQQYPSSSQYILSENLSVELLE